MSVAVAPIPAAVPKVGPFRSTRLPAVEERTLGNGLRALAVRKPGIPLVQARVVLPARRPRATTTDRAKQLVLAETLLSGTRHRDSVEVAEALQRMGATLNVRVDSEDLRLQGAALSPSLGDYLALLAELLAEPAFPKGEVEIERARKAQEVLLQRSEPAVIARAALKRRLFGEHPYAGGLPEPDEVGAVSAADLRRYFTSRVTGRDGLLILVGDLRPAKALDAAEAALGSWTGATKVAKLPALPPIEPGPILLVDRPGAAQSNIRIGGPALTRRDAGLPALLLANMIFGGYFSSRLVENIRERKGYTYSPRSWIDHQPLGSVLTIQADVGTEVTAPALLEMRYELGRMATLPVSGEELDAARRYLIGTTALSTQTQSGLTEYLLALSLAGLGLDYLRDLPKRLEKVTVGEVRDAGAEYLAPARLPTVIVGDTKAIRRSLETLDTVEDGPQP
ncbi:MAG TPA: pitrilysin family protein [Acidimicrobiia bacterium]|jgi:predicted Zn-dependent peptidase|nr:pitrilysin family protein [Acidimicrobiia bacterium]